MTEPPRHDTQEMSTEEIREAIETMDPDSVTPPSMISEVILAAQFPDGVTCPDCGCFFVPKNASIDDKPTLDDENTLDDSVEAPTRAT
jgi:hypothetical protein